MRRWLAMLMGTAAIAVAGTALALTGELDHGGGEEVATETTVEVEEAVTTLDEPLHEEPTLEALEAKPAEYELPEPDPVHRDPVEDTTPPEIVILHPEDGQVFERKEVVFEGETERGARVFAGDHEAEVSDGGAWRIVLHLSHGENVVTIKAVDASENVGTDTVTVLYKAPEKPKADEPKEDEPNEEPAEWKFAAHQVYGSCGEDPPYDVFHGTGKPGTVVHIESEFGGGVAEVGKKGGWEIKVIFEAAPIGEAFAVHVSDEFGNHKVFEFIRTG